MSLVAFSPEEQVEAFGETLTLRLDFRAITVIEGALDVDFPTAVAQIRAGQPSFSVLTQVLWAVTREYHSDLTHNQLLTILMEQGPDGAKVGFALDALLERAFPLATEDRKAKNPPKRNGRSKSSGASGSRRTSTPKASGEKVPEPS